MISGVNVDGEGSFFHSGQSEDGGCDGVGGVDKFSVFIVVDGH